MNLRAPMLFAGLLAGTLYGQTAAPTTPPAAQGANSTTKSGSAPTRATGLPPTSPALSGTSASSGPLANANGTNTGDSATSGGASNGSGANPAGRANRNRGATARGANRSNSLPPAPAATAKIEVTGIPSQNRTGTADRPLLPIVSPGNALGIRSGTPIHVKLRDAVDSGHVRNGDTINGTLAAPIANLPIGTPVRLTVVQSAPAGLLTSYGQLSIQVVSIADRNVLSDTVTAEGKEGAKELPDAAPARGTEAIFSPDEPISLPAS